MQLSLYLREDLGLKTGPLIRKTSCGTTFRSPPGMGVLKTGQREEKRPEDGPKRREEKKYLFHF